MNWSHFQEAIFKAVAETDDSLLIEACAGSGKTTTLVEAIKHVPSEQSVVFLAFNKAIADTLRSRVTSPNARCMTLHACGLAAWKRFCGTSPRIDGRKTQQIIRELLSWPERQKNGQLGKLVGLAKQVGIVPLNQQKLNGYFQAIVDDSDNSGVYGHMAYGSAAARADSASATGVSLDDLPDNAPSPICICKGLVEDSLENWNALMEEYDIDTEEVDVSLARRVLRESIARSLEVIDFDDMLYLPVISGAPFQKYDVVFVDEAQDVSGIQMEMISRMI